MNVRRVDDLGTSSVQKFKDNDKIVGADRRTALAMMGLAPVGALGIEGFLKPVKADEDVDLHTCTSTCNQTISTAFRKLADAIDRGDVLTSSLRLHSELSASKVMEHMLAVDFVYKV